MPLRSCSVVRWSAVCAVVAIACSAQRAGAAPDAATVQVTENQPGRVVLDIAFSAPRQDVVRIDGQPHMLPSLGREPRLLVARAPDLPHVCRSVAIPQDGEPTLIVDPEGCRFYELADVDVAPSKGNLLRTTDPATVAFVKGDVYRTNAFYPAELAVLQAPYLVRAQRGVVVDMHPLQYNPVRRTLRIYTSMRVVIETPGGTRTANAAAPRAFELLYQRHFVNYARSGRALSQAEDGRLVILCPDAWLPSIQPLVDYRTSLGMQVQVVGTSYIPDAATAAGIRAYIQSQYNAGDLAYVLLVGDAAYMPTPLLRGGAADPLYALCAGGDNYPDIVVGRFSAETAEQVDTQVQRTIAYEQMPATTQDWFWRGLGIASAEGGNGQGDDGESDIQHLDNIRSDLLGHGYTQVDQVYDPGAATDSVTTALNAGRGLVNYCGHGTDLAWSTTGFGVAAVNALQNTGKLPIIVSVACQNGNFTRAEGPCFAEAWLRATQSGYPVGAAGAYMSSLNQSWSPPMSAQDEIVDRFVAEDYASFGALCFAGACRMLDDYGAVSGAPGADTFSTWHVFGDPALRVVGVAVPPTGLAVSPTTGFRTEGPYRGPFTPGTMDFTLRNFGSQPIEYEMTTDVDWLILTWPRGTLQPGASALATAAVYGRAYALFNGEYTGTLTFTNLTNHVGDTTRPVRLKVGVSIPQYSWNLDTNPGFGTQGQWAWGQPQGQGGTYGYPDPTSGATGTNVYGVNLAGDYPTAVGGPYYLGLGPVDLSGISNTTLRFQRWLNTDAQPYTYVTVEVSAGGGTWTEVFANSPSAAIADFIWSPQTLDISGVADNQSAVYVRWGYRIGQVGAWPFSGWNIDDIQIWGLSSVAPTGACCQLDGTCLVTTAADCLATYHGDGSTCTPNPCPPPTGACCHLDGSCTVTGPEACVGTYSGHGTRCTPNPCPPPRGACCYPDGWCTVTAPGDCTATYLGNGTGCAPNPCPQPATCVGDANCDGLVNWRDIDFFIAGQGDNRANWLAQFDSGLPRCPFANLDTNQDGHVNWLDIDLFIARMNDGCAAGR
jgi:hypothetical protein